MINFKKHLATILHYEHVMNIKPDVEDEFFRLADKRASKFDTIGFIALDNDDIQYLRYSNKTDIYTIKCRYHNYIEDKTAFITIACDHKIENVNCEKYFDGNDWTYRLTVNDIILDWLQEHTSFKLDGFVLKHEEEHSSAVDYDIW